MRVLDIDDQEIELRDMDDEDDDLITVDALTKFAEQQSARDAQSQKPTVTPKDEEAVENPLD